MKNYLNFYIKNLNKRILYNYKMAMNNNFDNILKFIGLLYPYFIICFLLIATIFNLTFLKGIIFFSGILFSGIIFMLIGKLFGISRPVESSIACDLFTSPYDFFYPNLPIIISFFTLTYLSLPMIESSRTNPMVIGVLSILSLMNAYYQYLNLCTDYLGIVISIIIGSMLGCIWFAVIWSSGKKDLLFYNELVSNNLLCNRPSQQTFKCTVYKNGEIISSNIV